MNELFKQIYICITPIRLKQQTHAMLIAVQFIFKTLRIIQT